MANVTASRQPSSFGAVGPAILCGLAGMGVFQFFGNATRGYIDSASLFYWWGCQWLNPQSETEHGLLILPLAVGLLVFNLRARSEEKGEGNGWVGLAAMVVGLLLHVVGFAAQQTRVSIVALLIFTWGVLLLGGGKRWGDAAMFPLAFLVFAIPFNALDSIGFWLRLWVMKASGGLAHAAGIGVVQNGTQLISPDGRYQYDVAAACSGVRSLMALLALSLLWGYLNFRSWWRRGLLLMLCFPLIYLGNVVRISSIIFVAQWRGQAAGEQMHGVMNYGVFIIVLGGVMLAARLMRAEGALEQAAGSAEQGRQSSAGFAPAVARETGRKPALLFAITTVALAVGEMFFLAHLAAMPQRGKSGVRLAADGINPVELPAFLGTEWVGRRVEVSAIEREILPPDTGYSRKEYVSVANPAHRVFMSVVLSGRDRTSIHRPELCLVGQGWTIVSSRSDHGFRVLPWGWLDMTFLQVQHEARTPRGLVVVPQLVAYCFVGGDAVVRSHARYLAIDAWNRLTQARADRWAYVLIQTDASDGEAAAIDRMVKVLDQTMPVLAPAERTN